MTMLRSIAVALGGAVCLFAFAALGEWPGGAVIRALTGVALGACVTALVYGQVTFLAVALGAVSPLVFAAIDPISRAAAATAMCLLWLAPRFVLTESRRKLVTLAAVSLMAAAIAGAIWATYQDAPFAAHAASCVFAGSCLSLVGVVVQVPTTTAHALRTAAAAIDAPIGEVLMRSAQAHDGSRWQPQTSGSRCKWRAMLRLSDERAALERAMAAQVAERRREVDERIEGIARELLPSLEIPEARREEGAPDEKGPAPELDTRSDEPIDSADARLAPPADV